MIVNEMKTFKNGTIKIAEQLMYPKEIISQIKEATSTTQISSIMKQARLSSLNSKPIAKRT